jgi:hypothetical protein
MENDILIVDHISLLKSTDLVDRERILELSKNVDKVFQKMQRCRVAFKRASKMRKIFNI